MLKVVRSIFNYKHCYWKICLKSIMTTPFTMDKALENLQNNPYYAKYSQRIAELQKTSPEEFLKKVEKQQKTKKDTERIKFHSIDTSQFSSVLKPKEGIVDASSIQEAKLNDILKLDLVKDKTSSEIQALWEEYHKNKDVISATIPKEFYSVMQENMKSFVTFLFPLPRSHGYEFIMCQNFGHSIHFTPLLAFQVHKENAPECLKMVHYTELSHKGIVLMRGEYDKNVINSKEAQCLANQFQMYYNGKNQEKLKLLETFTRDPASFKHMDLISQLENISLE